MNHLLTLFPCNRAFISIFLFSSCICLSQKTHSIEDFINYSKKTDFHKEILKRNEITDLKDVIFKKSLLPNISLNFTLPSYSRSITEVLQPDGSYAFRESNTASSKLNFSVSQKIPLTGGKISISNSFNRLDVFRNEQQTTNYSASWLGINLNQPLNFFGAMKWDIKINNARTKALNINLKKDFISLKKKTIDDYFNFLILRQKEKTLIKEILINKKYKFLISKLIKSGNKILFDSIDINIKLIEKKQNLKYLNRQKKLQVLKINNTYFNNSFFNTLDSLTIPNTKFNLKNVAFYLNKFTEINNDLDNEKTLQYEKNIKELKSNKFYKANLSLGIGYNNSAQEYQRIFQTPNQSQNFSLSLSIPILNFKKQKTELIKVNTEYEVLKLKIKQKRDKSSIVIKETHLKIEDLLSDLKIERMKKDLLLLKLKRQQRLLFDQKILLKDYSISEHKIFISQVKIIETIYSIYKNILKLEKITLIKII
ncbi:hypothetical protein F7642_02330 [Tenacibaculum finnmarkense genomovar ulcerans]|uniref:TolC family protein n=1 Tax=Tenacibaculum finnmarkense TaxID=2781243 RepID=UPI00187B5730|nr:TolC family protein [Tenacibaculum finnmarkense]MBE7633166.1 hypothetical protein [Tenacibaculum finnmarkense genomovar ulcerans]MCD8429080.1 hypothetical protein [Tenacibaculum finnmarkense genomovar ulcerans]